MVLKARTLPSGKIGWRARFDDPETGRETYVTLDLVALPTHEARELWAKRKSKSIAVTRMELKSGGRRTTAKGLGDAISDYLDGAKIRLRGKTLVTYGLAISKLTTWAKREGIESTGDVTRERLANLRDYLIARPRKAAKKGGKRGERKEAARRRSPVSVNRELRTLKTLLNAMRTAGLLPHVDRDAIADTLKALPVMHEQPAYLSPAQIDKLLHAAMRHDAAVFKETRAEHAKRGAKGTTRRYEPIAPFAAFLLLTGCRRGEALGLKWSDVDLEAVDTQGRVVGEIRLRAENTKTHRARTIGLEVSPALRAMLATMKLRAADAAELHVFGGAEPYTVDVVEAARRRLTSEYGAPAFDWQTLRSTCATFLTNAPAIFGAATVFMSARQLGHSVTVAERHYLGVHRGIPREANTLEAAMQIESVVCLGLSNASTPAAAMRSVIC